MRRFEDLDGPHQEAHEKVYYDRGQVRGPTPDGKGFTFSVGPETSVETLESILTLAREAYLTSVEARDSQFREAQKWARKAGERLTRVELLEGLCKEAYERALRDPETGTHGSHDEARHHELCIHGPAENGDNFVDRLLNALKEV